MLQNEFQSLKSLYENEKNAGVCLVNRINELEATVQLVNAENSRLKEQESFNLNEMAKLECLLNQLRKEKQSLEHQLKNIELNISEQDESEQQQNHLDDASRGDLVNDVLKKFNEERKARQAAEGCPHTLNIFNIWHCFYQLFFIWLFFVERAHSGDGEKRTEACSGREILER